MNGYDQGENGRHPPSRDAYGSRDDRRDRDRDPRRGERRRSRSPHRGARDPRDDAYASSRNHRAQEREDRYGGRRDDRGWDRDRGARPDRDRGIDRRDNRRDDDRRRNGDRELFADRDRGGRRDPRDGGRGPPRGDRDEFAQQQRARKSASPPPKKREPTPDLTDIVPINERRRRLTQWDIKPQGYEAITAEQAKLSGMFPLPGAPRAQQVDPSKLQAILAPGGAPGASALRPSNSRQSKRLIVSNFPPNTVEEVVVAFFNLQLNGLNVVEGTDPCVSAHMNLDRSQALLEFKKPSDATLALALDGVSMVVSAGMNGSANGDSSVLSIRRPQDYIVSSEDSEQADASNPNLVPESVNKISITNIIPNLTQEQIQELLVTFGPLKGLVLVADRGSGESRGIAFCEYVDPAITDSAIEQLNGMELGPKALKVQRASIGMSQSTSGEMSAAQVSQLASTEDANMKEERVLQLLNMVTAEELIDNDEYEEILEDINDECGKYGKVVDVKIPRPSLGSRQTAGVGKVFIKFDNVSSAKAALVALAGRKFADRTVVTTYFSEEAFDLNAW